MCAAPTLFRDGPFLQVSIYDIQFVHHNLSQHDLEDDDEGILGNVTEDESDCYPSRLVGKGVNITGVVTASNDEGFYIQDNNNTWSGIYVNLVACTTGFHGDDGYSCSDNGLAQPKSWVHENIGNRVEVHGMVKEMNGTTEIVTVVFIDILGNASIPEPLNISTGNLGTHCNYHAEHYEGIYISPFTCTFFYPLSPINREYRQVCW